MAKSKSKKPRKEVPVKPSPRQTSIPGMEDRKIEALHSAALDYADIRDQRQELTLQEVDLKSKLLDLMHTHKRETYTFNGVTITVVHEEENVKVRVKKEDPGIPADTVG